MATLMEICDIGHAQTPTWKRRKTKVPLYVVSVVQYYLHNAMGPNILWSRTYFVRASKEATCYKIFFFRFKWNSCDWPSSPALVISCLRFVLHDIFYLFLTLQYNTPWLVLKSLVTKNTWVKEFLHLCSENHISWICGLFFEKAYKWKLRRWNSQEPRTCMW